MLEMTPVSSIDVSALEELQRKGPVVLIDVRSDAEVSRGMIYGARHVPLQAIPERYTGLDASAVTVIYCQSGARSAQACAWLGSKGFQQIYNLEGGIGAWLRSGLALTPPV
ncbi:MAG: rhodanese-like domain-containing protein [Betaproteobacteria bacterium]